MRWKPAVSMGLMSIFACAEQGPAPEARKHDTSKANEEEGPLTHDGASPSEVMLEWVTSDDGTTAVEELRFDLSNHSEHDYEVELRVISQGLGNDEYVRSLGSVTAPASRTRSHGVAISELPFQLAGVGVSTRLVAVWTGADGQERFVPAPSLHVEHTSGLDRAFVRGNAAEARRNGRADRPLSKLLPAAGTRTRRFDKQTQQFVDGQLDRAELSRGFGRVVKGHPELGRVRREAGPLGESALQSDANPRVLKSGNQNLCLNLPYFFIDDGNEDHLIGSNSSGTGWEPARNMFVRLVHLETGDMVDGFLDNNGCTGSIFLPDGTITVGVAHVMARSNRTAEVWWDEAARQNDIPDWQLTTFSVSGPISGTRVFYLGSANSLNNVAVALNKAFTRKNSAFETVPNYIVYAYDTSCGSAAGCAGHSTVWLGEDHNGLHLAVRKYIVLHEVGHLIQSNPWYGAVLPKAGRRLLLPADV